MVARDQGDIGRSRFGCVIATELGDVHGLVAAVGVSISSSRVAGWCRYVSGWRSTP